MKVMVKQRATKVYPWGERFGGVWVPIIDSMHHIGDDNVLTQLLECDVCQEWSDEVAWDDSLGGGACPEHWTGEE